MPEKKHFIVPQATLFLGAHCPHCETMEQQLTHLLKLGELSQLTLINIDKAPDLASAMQVRSLPWVQIGFYPLSGAQSIDALRQRIQWSADQQDTEGRFDHLLSEAQAYRVVDELKQQPHLFQSVLNLLGNTATILSTRIGIGVVMEELEGSELLQEAIPQLSKFASHKDSRIRADACHYLGLTQSKDAISVLESLNNEPDSLVREVIQDSLESLSE